MAKGERARVATVVLDLIREIVGMPGGGGVFKKDCVDLVRRVSLLTHFVEEMRDESGRLDGGSVSCSSENWWSDLMGALQDAKRLLLVAVTFKPSDNDSEGDAKRISFQFQCVTCKLEEALVKIPYNQLEISEEVQEQVALVRSMLRRAIEKYGFKNSGNFQPMDADTTDREQKGNMLMRSLHFEDGGSINHKAAEKLNAVFEVDGLKDHIADQVTGKSNAEKTNLGNRCMDDLKKPDMHVIPVDFLCPISLELMRDPVIVSTGQTYERCYIQRWMDTGNISCPKTQQKLEHLILTPNYVLKSVITQWCEQNHIEQPSGLANGKLRQSDGSFRDVSEDIAAIQAIFHKLSSQSVEECRCAVSEIRSLSKRSTDNRILIAEAGAIPVLVSLLTAEDMTIQENAVTSILNLSIYENNKGLIMLAGAVPSIVKVLRSGSMEARESAAATLFSLSLADENKIIIGASGAIPALVELLRNGSGRGKKDAATALFNLCIYQGNKGRAVRAGIITALLNMLTDPTSSMVDEALTILSVLSSNQEAKTAIVKATTIPVLIDLLRTGLPRNKENAAAILLSLCRRHPENLASVSRLGGFIPLMELAKNGTERAKRKATSILEPLQKLHQHSHM